MSRYSVILVADPTGLVSASVPAMPGCVSVGHNRDDALAHARIAMAGWIEAESAVGRAPLQETPGVVAAGVAQALEIIDEMRAAGEIPAGQGYDLHVASVDIAPPVAA